MLGYATASPMAAQIATPSNNANTPPAIVNTPRSSVRAARAAQRPEAPPRGAGTGSFAGVRSGSLMNVGRDVSVDYRNRQVRLKRSGRRVEVHVSGYAIFRAVSTMTYGDQMPRKCGHSRTLTLFSCRSC